MNMPVLNRAAFGNTHLVEPGLDGWPVTQLAVLP
jgi:hypothetical protein